MTWIIRKKPSKQPGSALAVEREFSRRVVASIPSGILVVSGSMEVQFASEALRKMLRLSGSSPDAGLASILSLPVFRDYVSQVLKRCKPLRDVSLSVPDDGGPRHFRATFAGLRRAEEEEEEEEAIVVIDDVTDQKRAEALRALHHEIDTRLLGKQMQANVLQIACDGLARLYGCSLVCFGTEGGDGSTRELARGGPQAQRLTDVRLFRDHPSTESSVPTLNVTGRQEPDRLLTFAVPAAAQGQSIGVFVLYADRNPVLTERDAEQIHSFADSVALSLLSARSQERIRLQTVALESAANAIAITDALGVIQWVNRAFTRLTGYAVDEAVGKTPRILKSGQHTDAFYKDLWGTIQSGRVWQGQIVNRRKDGALYTEEQTITPIRGADGSITHFITIKVDITERKRQDERIEYLATHDPLTELPNRRVLEEYLQRVVSRAQRGQHGALLFLDLDNFKLVNDTAGHAVGDEALVAGAGTIRDALRSGDLLARMGGDEFAVLLESTSLLEAEAIAQRILQKLQEFRWNWGEHRFDLAVSIGIAAIDGEDAGETLMMKADSALYKAKEHGRNQYVVYRPGGEVNQASAEVAWLGRIKDAFRRDGFCLYLQPVVELKSGTPYHVEALIRMTDEQGALVLPDEFLPRAERFGLMPQIGRWVLERAVEFLRMQPHLRVFINLSGSTLTNENLIGWVETSLQKNGVAPDRLGFEITETTAVLNLRRAHRVMHQLKALGCRFALDDFGMGFSSFSHLRTLPVDYVKLDGSFTQHLDTDPANRALVQAMTSVAHALGMRVIAEKVEREADAVLLLEAGVDYGQGYLWGKPSPEAPLLHRCGV